MTAKSERGEHVGICASFEKASGKNNLIHVSNVNDETHDVPNEVSELCVPETRFDQQTHTHHNSGVNKTPLTRLFSGSTPLMSLFYRFNAVNAAIFWAQRC